MSKRVMTRSVLIGVLSVAAILLAAFLAARPRGPRTVDTTSAQFATLQQKIDFLNQYVSFRHTYHELDFAVYFVDNGGGMVPGPSEWDIRLVAIVPEETLNDWVPDGAAPLAGPPDRKWLDRVPTSQDLSGIDHWYDDSGRTVGIDRQQHLVACRYYAF